MIIPCIYFIDTFYNKILLFNEAHGRLLTNSTFFVCSKRSMRYNTDSDS